MKRGAQLSFLTYGREKPDLDYLTRTEEFTVYNKRDVPFHGEISVRILSFDDLVFSPIPQLKCVQCGFFGRTFFCNQTLPPYYSWREKLKKYNFFLLITGKIDVRDRIEDNLKLNTSEWRTKFYAGNEGTNILKKRVKDRLSETKNYLSVFTKARFLSTGGGCTACKICGVKTSEPCKHPEIAAPSPEAIGIDLYKMLPEIDVPPVDFYYIVSMVYGDLKDFTPKNTDHTHNVTEEKNIFNINLEDVIKIHRVEDIWDPEYSKSRCETCEFYSPFLCNRKRYIENDLYETIKNKNLYVIKLKNNFNTIKGIKELHEYQLYLHRQGFWDSFQLMSVRCPICHVCNLDVHMGGKYKDVQNRAIPFCISYMNLRPEEKGKNIGYILV